jgi:hypothetical protein
MRYAPRRRGRALSRLILGQDAGIAGRGCAVGTQNRKPGTLGGLVLDLPLLAAPWRDDGDVLRARPEIW